MNAELVGRDAERAAVGAFLDPDGAWPRTLVLEGEPGIGKTSLWREAIARSPWRALVCRPVSAEAQLAFAALSDLVDPVVGEVAGALPAPQARALRVALLHEDPEDRAPDQRAVAAAVLGALRALAREQPVLVAIDDAQWLDPASAAVLDFVFRRLDRIQVAVLVATRGGEPLSLDGVRLRVGPLGIRALHQVVRASVGVALTRPALVRVHQVSGGNPFYAVELARAASLGEQRIPANLQKVVRDRLSGLGEDADTALLVAALAAQPTVALVEAAGGSFAALRRAADAGIVELDGERVRFGHPLLAAAVVERAHPGTRREVHARLASVATVPEECARHLALAAVGVDAAVAERLDEAAAHAGARGASTTAGELGELAARLTPPEDAEAGRRRLRDAAEHHFTAGGSDRARDLLEQLRGELGAGPERADVLLRLAYLANDYDAAARLCEQALADTSGDAALRGEAHRVYSEVLLIRGSVGGALEHARLAAELAERGGGARLARSLGDVALLETYAACATPGLLERAVELERSVPDVPLFYGPTTILGLRLMYADRLDEARRILEDVHERALAAGDETARASTLLHLADLELRAARWARADELAAEGYELADQSGFDQWRSALLHCRARAAAYRGRIDEARAAAEEGIATSERVKDEIFRHRNMAVLGFLELSVGDAAAAARYLTDVIAHASTTGYRDPSVRAVHPDAVEALVASGELDRAEPLAAELEDAGERLENPWARATGARCRGLLLAARGDTDGALAALERAIAEHERAASPFERARTMLVLGVTRRRAKQRRAAREALGAARAAFEDLGAALWAERAREELARIGGRRPGGSELTETERRIAELVAQGRSNKEVAAALYVTVRTVETNLSRVYAKLGVRSRTELAHRLAAA